jgi:hypothetical protein
MTDAILRALNEAGDAYEDPSEDLLFDLMSELNETNRYLIVERLSDPFGQTYVQTMREGDDVFLVEQRCGGPDEHFRAPRLDLRTAHSVLTGWAFDLADKRDAVEWSRVAL